MSTLSKILVVLLVVLAIAHSAILLAYLSQAEPWKELALGHAEQIKTMRTEVASYNRESGEIQEQLRGERDGLRGKLTASEHLFGLASIELNDFRRDLGRLTAGNERFRQQLANLTASLERAQKARDFAQSHLERAQDTANKLKAGNTGLERSVADLTRDLRVRNAEIRRQKEDIVSLQDQIRKASGRTTAGPATTAAVGVYPVMTRRAINGRVIGVRPDAKIATINVGSIAGVAKGNKFTIFERDMYVGDLMITRVFPKESLGNIVLSARPVRLGNQVSTDPLR